MIELNIGRRLVLGAVAALALTATIPGAQAQEKMKLKLILPTTVTTFMLPYIVPKDQGWYDKAGLDVEEVFVAGDSTALRTTLAGSGDITIVGPPTVFHAVLEGAKIKYIGSWQPIVDYHIVAAKSVGNSLKDLAGKTFASAGPSDLTTEVPKLVLKKHGVPTDNVKFLQVGGHPARLQAVEAGKVQAAMINTLTSLKGQQGGNVNVLAKVAQDFPSLGYVMLAVRDQDIADAKKRAAMETFIKGNIYGARYVMDHPEEAAKILNKRVPDMGMDLILPVVKELNATKVWGINGGLDADVVKFTSDVSVQWGMISKPVKAEDIIDDSFVKKALAEMGRR